MGFYKKLIFGVSPSGKAAGFGPAIRRFESFHPRIRIKKYTIRGFLYTFRTKFLFAENISSLSITRAKF